MSRTRSQPGVRPLMWLAVLWLISRNILFGAGAVVSWGNLPANLKAPADLTGIVSVTPNLALKSDGTVIAWGNNSFGQRNVPVGLNNVLAIAEGYAHRLALKNDGSVVAWGAGTNNSGDTWTYSHGQSIVPAGLANVTAIAAGWRHSLALRADGSVVGWGFNSFGQTNVPASLGSVTAIAVGTSADFNVALRTDGTVIAWGGTVTMEKPMFLRT
jgi:alpha-tubulin suppressor-like RCC1 family protein